MIDLPGKAIHDYHFFQSRKKLYVNDTFGPKVEMPISYYFRKWEQMPDLERLALEYCEGRVLDIGAASGCHTLVLQKKNIDVTALELSPNSCKVMYDLGVNNVVCEDFFKYHHEDKFDTLLLLMNGIGVSSTTDGFRKFLKKANELLLPEGQIIFDSCDISYMYDDFEMPKHHYFGEAKVRYEYDNQFTECFNWLYIDQDTMQKISKEEGWNSEIVFEDDSNQYLAILERK